ncbi:hypothetical protein G6F52_013926 [Rhizopus delemar]|nr:hypothetical protein G6F52_013926 [Rhizopus delemar]
MLLRQNPLWSNPRYTGGYTSVDDRLAHLSTDARVKKSVLAYRTDLLQHILGRPAPPVLLSACRPIASFDGVWGGSLLVLSTVAAVRPMPLVLTSCPAFVLLKG